MSENKEVAMLTAINAKDAVYSNCAKGNFIINLNNRINDAIKAKKMSVEYTYIKDPTVGELEYIKSLGYVVSHTDSENLIYVSWKPQ